MEKAKIVFYPNTDKKSVKTNQTPVYLRISKGRIKCETKLEASIAPEDLKFWNVLTQRLDKKGTIINRTLEEIEFNFDGLAHLYKESYKNFTPLEIKNKLFGSKDENNALALTVMNFVEDYFVEIIVPNSNITVGTKKNYRKSINHFSQYLKFVKQKNIRLTEFLPPLAFDDKLK